MSAALGSFRYRYVVSNKESIEDGEKITSIAIDRALISPERPQGVSISFWRTLRLPENRPVSQSPRGFGCFPLYKVRDYASCLPEQMINRGGFFLPMYQKEAMWVQFKANAPFMIKIYCGGVNVISGEQWSEDDGTRQRRANLPAVGEQGKLIQDYVVVPDQKWLDGRATQPSVVRQFVAMPVSEGYSVDVQLAGNEGDGQLQFEITPAYRDPESRRTLDFYIRLDTIGRKPITFSCSPTDLIGAIKNMLFEMEDIPVDHQTLLFAGTVLENYKTLNDYNVKKGDTVYLILRARGGRPHYLLRNAKSSRRINFAAGGKPKPDIRQDSSDPGAWLRSLTLTIPVQILNSRTFRAVTGHKPPACPIDRNTYEQVDLPFYEVYEERPSDDNASEDFNALRSVKQIELARGQPTYGSGMATTVWNNNYVFEVEDFNNLLSPVGPRRRFRTLADLQDEIRNLKQANQVD